MKNEQCTEGIPSGNNEKLRIKNYAEGIPSGKV